MAHLQQKSPLCLLNLVVRVLPFSDEEERVQSEAQLVADRGLAKRGLKAGSSTFPAFRRPWVTNRFIDLQGDHVPLSSMLHPNRVARVQYGWYGGENEIEAGLCEPCGQP